MATFAYRSDELLRSGGQGRDRGRRLGRGDRQDPRQGLLPDQGPRKGRQEEGQRRRRKTTRRLTPTRKMPISIGGVPRKQLVGFTRQLSTLQDAGLPILRSLQILEAAAEARACSRRSSAAWPTRSKAAARSPTRWPSTPRRSTSSTST